MQNSYQSPNSFNVLPLVIKNLLIINGLIFLASITPGISQYILAYLPLYYIELPPFLPTQFVTSLFVHDPNNFWHLFFNMFSLWMFGSVLENVWGPKKFLAYYLLAGIGSGLFHTLYIWVVLHFGLNLPVAGILMGASGAIYGLLLGYAFLFPDSYINIYFFIPIKAKYFMGLIIVMDLVSGIFSTDGIAHFAHIGGAITGLIVLLIWRKQKKLWGR